jgi:hypothetical protein
MKSTWTEAPAAFTDRRYDYEVVEQKPRLTPERLIAVPTVPFEMGDESVQAFVFPIDGMRQAPISPMDRKPMRRAGVIEVEGFA